jgi:H+/Cl- antiporter ClcA
MKKLLLPLVVSIGVLAGLAGITLIRLSKSMEDWEVSWDEGKEED